MEVKLTALTEIEPYGKNPRRITVEAIDKVARSITEYGWQQPIVVDNDGTIIVGHTRYAAARQLKLKKVPVVTAGSLTPEQAAGYRLADNRSSEETDWDMPELRSEILALTDLDFDITATLFDKAELTKLLTENPFDAYADGEKGALVDRFGVPPFSILDTRLEYWQERKHWWNGHIGDMGETRENTLADEGSVMEAIGTASILDAVLAELICRWFTLPGHKAFDCFAGDTVFGYVAGSCGLSFTGIELREEQASLNNKRVAGEGIDAKYICDDGQNMGKHIKDGSMDLFFTCPPYADLEVYSDLPNDLSTMEHDDFYKIYKNCLSQTYAKLKPNRFAVVVVSEVRNKQGGYISLVPETIRTMVEAGYQYWNELILVNAIGTLPLRASKAMQSGRKVGRMHQNVLIFYKDGPKTIAEEFGEVHGGFSESTKESRWIGRGLRRKVKSEGKLSHWLCPYCAENADFDKAHVDHIHPFVKGGLTADENMVLICHQCNRKKGGQTLRAYCKSAGLDYEAVADRLEAMGKYV